MKYKIAFDKSVRHIDIDGRLHVEKTHISMAAVNQYYGKEIPGYDSLGLQEDKIYNLLRDPIELEKSASSFARLPILKEHVQISADDPKKELVIGTIGSDVLFKDPYLDADICLWDSTAIAGIENNVIKELSCSYRYIPIMKGGEYNGIAYDGIMTDIIGNHLALVEHGRAGPNVCVADNNPFERNNMNNVNDPQQLDNIIDSALGIEDNNQSMNPVDKIKSLLSGKVDESVINEICAMIEPVQTDSAPCTAPPKEEPKDLKTAMDAYEKKFKVELQNASNAMKDVRMVVGDVFSMDSAEEIYKFALSQMKIDHEGISDLKALKTIFNVASNRKKESVALDSNQIENQFPNIKRFRSI